MLGQLSAQYESNGDPACISSGYGDPGGKSYGTYQFSSNAGSLDAFVNWISDHYPQYANQLSGYDLCSEGFDEAWRGIAESDPDEIMKDVVWSRAVQYGVGNILDMWDEAVHSMYNVRTGEYEGYPNLSYVDSPEYDYDFIVAVYNVCKSEEWNHSSLRDILNNRFDCEMHDALNRL